MRSCTELKLPRRINMDRTTERRELPGSTGPPAQRGSATSIGQPSAAGTYQKCETVVGVRPVERSLDS